MTATSFDMLLIAGRVVTPGGIVRADIGIRAGRIAAIGDLAHHDAGERLDLRGLHVLPGVIDTQVHFREPGNEHKEDLETGSRAAVLGGVVAVFEMPNTSPPTTTAEALADKLRRARGRMWCDHAFYVGATAENVAALPELERTPGVAGIKVFMGSSTGSLLIPDDATLERVLTAARRRVAIHAEDEDRLIARKGFIQPGQPASHPVWRDEETALRATRRVVALAERLHRRIHVLHVTTAEEMAYLARHKEWASVEVTPQHLTLEAPDCYRRLGSLAQMNPPIRTRRHRAALWQGLRDGVVDVIGSDHAPHTREEKARAYPQSPSGMPGVQTLLPLLLHHHAQGRVTLQRLVDLTSAGPARLFGLLGKGRIAVGYDADFSIVDLKARWTITEDWLASRAGWSPFTGMTITGRPVGTIIRGQRVMWEGTLVGEPVGRPLRFAEAV
ncbi:MAG: dihydroorotase [Alphaproteobacteria bacterium]|nr:MAG: dihydroorotase [Alphaproteobacteria bacterium]